MVAVTIANYIADNTNFALGTDIFMFNLPSTEHEGIVIAPGFIFGDFSDFRKQTLDILCYYRNPNTCDTNSLIILDLMDNMRGTAHSASWCVSSTIESRSIGKDQYGRYVRYITCEISYNK